MKVRPIAGDRSGRIPNCWLRHLARGLVRLLLLALAVASPLAAAEESSDAWKSFRDSVDRTLPLGVSRDEARSRGWWDGLWDGTKRIWTEGSDDLYLSGYFYHTPYKFSAHKRDEYNDNAWGLGYGRTLTEENDNQRMFVGMVTRDSHDKPMYLAGYVWLARWDFIRDVRVGAGYSALFIAHSTSTNYWPVPLLAPVVSIGTDNAAIYSTYFNGIVFFFTKFSLGR